MKKYPFLFILFLLPFSQLKAQKVLQKYLQEGLENNQQLLREALAYEQQQSVTRASGGLFLPQVDFQASYTLADGGRVISFPVGDLLNPVYSTLNDMTGSNQFPQLENVNEQFLPNDFHETKVRLIQPLFNLGIYYNREINRALERSAEAKMQTAQLNLVFQIRSTYYDFLSLKEQEKVVASNIKTLEEVERFNQKRFEQGLITEDEVLIASYNIAELQAQQEAVKAGQMNLQSYFNFLLNRSMDSAVHIDSGLINQKQAWTQNEDENLLRPETAQLEAAQEAQLQAVKLAQKSRYLPEVNLVGDVGFQGFGYSFDSDQDFWLLNFSMNWNLFNGGQKKEKATQATLEFNRINSMQTELRSAISMEITQASANVKSAEIALKSREKSLQAAEKVFKITEKRYQAGQALFLEYNNALNDYRSARSSYNNQKFTLFKQQAALQKALGIALN